MTRDTREKTARIREETAIIEKETAQFREQTERLKEENSRLREEIHLKQAQRRDHRIKMERKAEDRLQSIELRLQQLETALKEHPREV
jgi:division protein CdvB (Snf7/Vps24/ESCRT-III family)